MDSDLQPHQYHHHFQGQFQLPKQQMSSGGGGGLTRYRSAPSSYFTAFTDPTVGAAGAGDLPLPKPLSPDTEAFLARFVQSVTDSGEGGFDVDSPAVQPDFPVVVKQEADQQLPISNTGSHQSVYHSSNKPPLARRSSNSIGGSRCGMESNFRVPNTNFTPMKMETGLRANASSLTRHRSSPAGLFDDIIIENGYLVSRGSETKNYGSSNMSINNQEFSSPASKVNNEMNLSSANVDDSSFVNNFPVDSWNDSSLFSDQFSRPESGVGELNPSDNQEEKEESRKRPLGLLAHHLSLPQASLEKLMQLQDTVPCQMRAKRGCATHPRSIAERVRRTKISERMRKLQDLVPNMDKQTNTSDMLDFAAEYIKDLQRQVQTLSSKRARCTCS